MYHPTNSFPTYQLQSRAWTAVVGQMYFWSVEHNFSKNIVHPINSMDWLIYKDVGRMVNFSGLDVLIIKFVGWLNIAL